MSLQTNIDAAGGALQLLRAGSVEVDGIFPYPDEYAGWRAEQRAWSTTAVLFDQSFHMSDLFISGQDTVRLLSDTSVNSYANFRPGIAKQYIAVNDEGQVVGDSIMVALSEQEVTVAGFEHALNWLQFHAEHGGYDVSFSRDPASRGEAGSKRLYRYELEGPAASTILAAAADEPLGPLPFFNTGFVKVAGHDVSVLNHTMGGVPGSKDSGYELFGPTEDEQDVISAILSAGEAHGLHRAGAKAYFSTLAESGWMGALIPAIYSLDSLREYREWLPDLALENFSIGTATGSFQPDDVAGYYVTPWDHGYGHVIKFDHDFIGRDALEAIAAAPPRQRAWLIWEREDTERILIDSQLGTEQTAKPLVFPGLVGRDQVLIGDRLVGVTQLHGYTVNIGGWVSVASIDTEYAEDGTEVETLWGNAGQPQTRIRATISRRSPVAR